MMMIGINNDDVANDDDDDRNKITFHNRKTSRARKRIPAKTDTIMIQRGIWASSLKSDRA